jgi:predicted aspartyl protease
MPHLSVPTKPNGAMLDIVIGVSIPRQQKLHRSGQPIPKPVTGRALVDTGATPTCIDPGIAARLGLKPIGTSQVHTPSTQGVAFTCNVYDVSLVIPTSPGSPFRIMTLAAFESSLTPQGIDVLIGRDVLEHATMFYDGPNGRMTMSF